jgi:hypothetical protein
MVSYIDVFLFFRYNNGKIFNDFSICLDSDIDIFTILSEIDQKIDHIKWSKKN